MKKSQELIDYQYRMCLYGQPEHILSYQITIIGDSCDYRVTESDLKPVWTDGACLTEEEVQTLLLAFAGMLRDCRDYLLDFGCVTLDDDGFFRRKDGTIGFMYQPFKNSVEEDHRGKAEGWLARLHHHVDMANEAIMTMLHPLSIVMAEENFTLDGFEALIDRTVEG